MLFSKIWTYLASFRIIHSANETTPMKSLAAYEAETVGSLLAKNVGLTREKIPNFDVVDKSLLGMRFV